MENPKLLKEGQVIHNMWKVESFLGNGAFGEVYRVKHLILDRREAMKVLKTVGMSVEETRRELREAILLSKMDHPNIIQIYGANTTETTIGVCAFFTMQYVAGGSLDKFWRSHGNKLVPTATAVDIATQVARGLSAAHSENPPIIHRDIKPDNILIGFEATGLRARVSDFGLAKRVNPLSLRASGRGAIQFKAPEALLEQAGDSCAGDVWALGTTFYLLLTDRLPYPDLNQVLAHGGKLGPWIAPSRLNPAIDPMLEKILTRALQLRREDRYANAMEMLLDFEKWQPQGKPKVVMTSEYGKQELGPGAQGGDKAKAEALAAKALSLARGGENLKQAADLLEQALIEWPELRERHEHRIKLWRKNMVI